VDEDRVNQIIDRRLRERDIDAAYDQITTSSSDPYLRLLGYAGFSELSKSHVLDGSSDRFFLRGNIEQVGGIENSAFPSLDSLDGICRFEMPLPVTFEGEGVLLREDSVDYFNDLAILDSVQMEFCEDLPQGKEGIGLVDIIKREGYVERNEHPEIEIYPALRESGRIFVSYKRTLEPREWDPVEKKPDGCIENKVPLYQSLGSQEEKGKKKKLKWFMKANGIMVIEGGVLVMTEDKLERYNISKRILIKNYVYEVNSADCDRVGREHGLPIMQIPLEAGIHRSNYPLNYMKDVTAKYKRKNYYRISSMGSGKNSSNGFSFVCTAKDSCRNC